MGQKVEPVDPNKFESRTEKEYLVKGTMTANVHAVVKARTANAARNKANTTEGIWWFDDQHQQTGVTITDVDIHLT